MTSEHGITWRKSSFSGSGGTGGGDCVEAAVLAPEVRGLRDSKNPARHLTLPASGLSELLAHVTR
ncbi:DUF397 domain-containing protein [Actinokineospora pegani]|uniref:DUF397 domain-containing protein n=1 Tax=Actinokineospora pegani TaxID=2654637 RepID=UPI0012E9B67C|nr:DUF397 domain-containing protein [Actinokineospora pegani]